MSANEQMAASEGLGFVPYTRPTGTDTVEPLKIGVLISGSGTNLQALIDLIAAGKLNASIELVVSSRPSAKGLQRAERAGIQTLTLSKDVYADPIAADEIIAHELLERGCEYVVMAGICAWCTHRCWRRFPTAWSTCIRRCCRALPVRMRLTMPLRAASR